GVTNDFAIACNDGSLPFGGGLNALQGSGFESQNSCLAGPGPNYCRAKAFPHKVDAHHAQGTGIDARYLSIDAAFRERFDRRSAEGKRAAFEKMRNYILQLRALDVDCLTGPLADRPEKCVYNGHLKFTGRECFMNREVINLLRTSASEIEDVNPNWLLDPTVGDEPTRRQNIPIHAFYENCPNQEEFKYTVTGSSSTHFAIDDVIRYQNDMLRGFRRLSESNLRTIYYTSDQGGFAVPDSQHFHARLLIGKVLRFFNPTNLANAKLNFDYPLYRNGTIVQPFDPFGLDTSGGDGQFVPNSNGVLKDVNGHADHLHFEAN
ncbi:MAG TPA: hypothetical protein PLZ57_15885, partial [Pseudobdellovibrionaceae bacterium]|nr:hypothetical protein [Pseudobdellovibrionaceae bacterium]